MNKEKATELGKSALKATGPIVRNLLGLAAAAIATSIAESITKKVGGENKKKEE